MRKITKPCIRKCKYSTLFTVLLFHYPSLFNNNIFYYLSSSTCYNTKNFNNMFFCNTSQVTLIKHVLSFLIYITDTYNSYTLTISKFQNVLENDVLFIVLRQRLTLFPYDKMLFIIIISSLLFTIYTIT